MTKIFIDGKEGTTGLRIYERLAERDDLNILTLSDTLRKDKNARREALNACDIAFLCLPDVAAKESVSLVENPDVRILDTSTAHRTDPTWVYGFPEFSTEQTEKIKQAKRVAVPGCHASGFIALVRPLIEKGILSPDALLTCHSITGYSGGGKKMIADYEDPEKSSLLHAPRAYALGQSHKHLPEMLTQTGLKNPPVFCPIVADFYSGMEVTVPLHKAQINGNIEDIQNAYACYSKTPLVHFAREDDENGFLSSARFSLSDAMQITVCGNADRFTLCARYDNLGKGASGAALACMNIMLGLDSRTGLVVD